MIHREPPPLHMHRERWMLGREQAAKLATGDAVAVDLHRGLAGAGRFRFGAEEFHDHDHAAILWQSRLRYSGVMPPPLPPEVAAPSTGSFARPDDALAALLAELKPVPTQQVTWKQAAGRVTAQLLIADRPSPPADVSAMDGYAVRLDDLRRGGDGAELVIAETVLPGRDAPPLAPGKAIAVMTGGLVPPGAEAIIRREDVIETGAAIRLRDGIVATITPGQHIRRRGENLAAGAVVVEAGRAIDSVTMAALAMFGQAKLLVRRRVRIAVVVTGDELMPIEAAVEPWQIRDSNGPALAALLDGLPWVKLLSMTRVHDDRPTMLAHLRGVLENADALLITGGVSMGTHDFVPGVLSELGCRTVFHKLPIRPGHPLLAAIGPGGQLVMGLPGNPVSVLTTARRFALPALAHRGGLCRPAPPRPVVTLANDDGRTGKLWWFRPVRLTGDGMTELVSSRGSGDVPSAARSDGFIEVPPNETGPGPWPVYHWSCGQ